MSKALPLTLLLVFFQDIGSNAYYSISDQKPGAFYSQNKEIVWEKSEEHYDVTIKEGDNHIFSITQSPKTHGKDESPLITLVFTVPSDSKSFTFTGDLTKKYDAFLRRDCRCTDAGYNKVTGVLHGSTEDSKTWHVKISVEGIGTHSGDHYLFTYEGEVILQ